MITKFQFFPPVSHSNQTHFYKLFKLIRSRYRIIFGLWGRHLRNKAKNVAVKKSVLAEKIIPPIHDVMMVTILYSNAMSSSKNTFFSKLLGIIIFILYNNLIFLTREQICNQNKIPSGANCRPGRAAFFFFYQSEILEVNVLIENFNLKLKNNVNSRRTSGFNFLPFIQIQKQDGKFYQGGKDIASRALSLCPLATVCL